MRLQYEKRNMKNRIKKLLLLLAFCMLLISFSACRQAEGGDLEQEMDKYVGEYNDYEVNDPSLEIQKNNDGTYTVQIGIFRLVYLDDGVGTIERDGIHFFATAPNGKEIEGTITLEEDVATVAFLSPEWEEYSSVKEYKYYKTSDSPNISIGY